MGGRSTLGERARNPSAVADGAERRSPETQEGHEPLGGVSPSADWLSSEPADGGASPKPHGGARECLAFSESGEREHGKL